MGREEIYIRYIYHLSELHKSIGSWVEAGFTLLLHAQLLQVWVHSPYLVHSLPLSCYSGPSKCRSKKGSTPSKPVLIGKSVFTMTL